MKSQFIIMFVMFPETAAANQFMILQIEQRPVLNAEVLLIGDFGLQPVFDIFFAECSVSRDETGDLRISPQSSGLIQIIFPPDAETDPLCF